jgi:hypothetical protein
VPTILCIFNAESRLISMTTKKLQSMYTLLLYKHYLADREDIVPITLLLLSANTLGHLPYIHVKMAKKDTKKG